MKFVCFCFLPTASGEEVIHRQHDTASEDIVPALCLVSQATPTYTNIKS